VSLDGARGNWVILLTTAIVMSGSVAVREKAASLILAAGKIFTEKSNSRLADDY
jgi:hypothetical protein